MTFGAKVVVGVTLGVLSLPLIVRGMELWFDRVDRTLDAADRAWRRWQDRRDMRRKP